MNRNIQKRAPKYGQSIHTRTFCAMLRMLHDGDVSKAKLMEELGLASGTVTKWMKLLGADQPHRAGRLVYISSWDRSGLRGNHTAMWSYGFEMADAIKPRPMTGTEYAQRYRAKKRGHLQLVSNHGSSR